LNVSGPEWSPDAVAVAARWEIPGEARRARMTLLRFAAAGEVFDAG
jgi:hypothetical protein